MTQPPILKRQRAIRFNVPEDIDLEEQQPIINTDKEPSPKMAKASSSHIPDALDYVQKLILQPMLTVTLLQCKSCQTASRTKYKPRDLGNGKLLLNLVLCDTCIKANKKVRYTNNYEILPANIAKYQQGKDKEPKTDN